VGTELILCKSCKSTLSFSELTVQCSNGHAFPVKESVVDLFSTLDYVDSFGEQWEIFAKTQIDSLTNVPLSKERFLSETNWSIEDLRDAIVLDAGCGSGRFTEIASRFSRKVIGVDLSSSVYYIDSSIKARENIILVRDDIRDLSLDFSKISHAFSIGVLQHTPHPYKTLEDLVRQLNGGTKFAITAYGRHWYTKFCGKYLLRPVSKRIPRPLLLEIISKVNALTYPIIMHFPENLFLRKVLKFVSPFSFYPELIRKMSKEAFLEYSTLDTFDALTPKYDRPLSKRKALKVLSKHCKEVTVISKVPLVLNGVK